MTDSPERPSGDLWDLDQGDLDAAWNASVRLLPPEARIFQDGSCITNALRSFRDRLRDRVEAAHSACEARLVEALEGLVNAVEETAMSSIGIFQFAALHGVVYNGMTTEAAMDRARAALAERNKEGA